MKTFRELLVEAQEISDLKQVLTDIWEQYVTETGDEEGENFDAGLTVLMSYADELPANIAAAMASDIESYFFEDDEDDDEDDIDESMLDENGEILDEAKLTKSQRQKLNVKRRQLAGSNKRASMKDGKLDVHIVDRARAKLMKGSLGKKLRKKAHTGKAMRAALKTKKKMGEL